MNKQGIFQYVSGLVVKDITGCEKYSEVMTISFESGEILKFYH